MQSGDAPITSMTTHEREEQILSSLALGPIFPLWGVVETSPGVLTCECGSLPNCKPGKHSRWRNFKSKATHDADRIHQWFRRYPSANYGVVTGPATIALDADVRPGCNGRATLEYLEIDEGERIPYTVEVVTGRDNGSRHFYFRTPAHAAIRTRAKVLPGLDVRAVGGYCVAPGSRHIEGGFYRFVDDCHPDEQPVADLPDFVLAAIMESTPGAVILGPQMPHSESAAAFATLTAPDQPTLPDGVVLGVMLRDPVARFYWNGRRRNGTASEDDFALACKLAFYCRHDLGQMYRLFMRSGLYRSKFEEHRPGGNYAFWTLREAIKATPQTWVRKKRQRPSAATGAKKGRRMLPRTVAVVDLHRREPQLTVTEIATQLGLTPKQVRDPPCQHS